MDFNMNVSHPIICQKNLTKYSTMNFTSFFCDRSDINKWQKLEKNLLKFSCKGKWHIFGFLINYSSHKVKHGSYFRETCQATTEKAWLLDETQFRFFLCRNKLSHFLWLCHSLSSDVAKVIQLGVIQCIIHDLSPKLER